MNSCLPATLADPTSQALLPAHLRDCAAARARLHGLRSLLDLADGFLTPRFVSTLALLVVMAGMLIWLTH